MYNTTQLVNFLRPDIFFAVLVESYVYRKSLYPFNEQAFVCVSYSRETGWIYLLRDKHQRVSQEKSE